MGCWDYVRIFTSRHTVWGLGFIISGLGFKLSGLGFRVECIYAMTFWNNLYVLRHQYSRALFKMACSGTESADEHKVREPQQLHVFKRVF